jgi:hypothetical protein
MFREALAEREENILQLCPLSKYLDSEAFCKAIVPRGGSWKRPGRWPSSNPTMSASPLTPECRAMGSPQETPWCTYKDLSNCRGGGKKGPAYRCVRVLAPEED